MSPRLDNDTQYTTVADVRSYGCSTVLYTGALAVCMSDHRRYNVMYLVGITVNLNNLLHLPKTCTEHGKGSYEPSLPKSNYTHASS